MTLRLRPLKLDDEIEARAAHGELTRDGFTFLPDWGPHDNDPPRLRHAPNER
jgi:hypothetical protein